MALISVRFSRALFALSLLTCVTGCATANSFPTAKLDPSNYVAVVAMTFVSEVETADRLNRAPDVHCTGVAIAPDIIVTAAHCLKEEPIITKWVILQGRALAGENGTKVALQPRSNRFHIGDWRIPDEFSLSQDSPLYYFDVAVILLKERLQIPEMKLFVLPRDPAQPDTADLAVQNDSSALFAGWGDIEHPDMAADLTFGRIPRGVKNATLCRHSGKGAGGGADAIKVADDGICFYPSKSAKESDFCDGNSGGPMFLDPGDMAVTRTVLLGVSSWGSGDTSTCASDNQISVFSRISLHTAWITQMIDELRRAALVSQLYTGPENGGRS